MQEQQHPGYGPLRTATFRKSSYSSGAQECVAVGWSGEWAGVQDTKQAKPSTLAMHTEPFKAFVAAAKAGQLDL